MSRSVQTPRGEIIWVSYFDAAGAPRFFMTSKPARDYYYLYEVKDDLTYVKLGKSKSPSELEQKYKVDQALKNACQT